MVTQIRLVMLRAHTTLVIIQQEMMKVSMCTSKEIKTKFKDSSLLMEHKYLTKMRIIAIQTE